MRTSHQHIARIISGVAQNLREPNSDEAYERLKANRTSDYKIISDLRSRMLVSARELEELSATILPKKHKTPARVRAR